MQPIGTNLVCRILLFLLIFVSSLAGVSDLCALTVEVKLEGLESPLFDNVLNNLSIHRHKDSARLNESDVLHLHRLAEKEIADAIAPYGYFHPEINVALHHEGESFVAAYTVNPGDPVHIRSIIIGLICDEEDQTWFHQAKNEFPLQNEAVIDQSLYEEGKKLLIRKAMGQGYLTARFVTHELRIDRREMLADIVLSLDSGPRYLFGDTHFTEGILRQKLLTGYLPYKKGEPYSSDKMIELQRTLYQSNYFRSVQVQGKRENADGLYIPVIVDMRAIDKLNRYSLGVGYATDTGARTRFDWQNLLINDRGHQMKATTMVSQYENNLGLTYEIPVGNPQNDNYSITAAYTDQNWDSTQSKLYSLAAGRERGGKFFRYGETLELRQEEYSVGVTSGDAVLMMPGLAGTYINADDVMNTKNGFEISLSSSGAMEGVVSDTSFAKLLGSGKIILSPLESWRVIGRGSLGTVLVSSIDDLPPSLRFYAGGDNSVRGYGYKKLGTHDASGAIIGGRYLMIGSAELEKSFSENKWSLAAFWDAGNAMDDLSINLKQGVGLGFRFRLPFGQVRVDVASAIQEDGMPLRLHLTVGSDL